MATVRIEKELHAKLKEISEAEHRPISKVIAEAVGQYEKEKFWAEMHESFARLRSDPAAWRAYEDEAATWDSLSGDGLEGEEPWPSGEGR